jgi:two-component system sensor histidine kinase BaeS
MVQVEDELPEIDGDPLRLEQVFTHLISNAVKYSPAGGEIVARVAREDTQVSVAISDQGIGIPANDLPHLFEQFYRSEHADSQGITGAGLGLYIVRQLVEAHGGTITVTSEVDAGSTFTVRLPLGSGGWRVEGGG